MPPILRKRRRRECQPPSTNWFDLPFEMREMVIDRMDSKTRCRFAQCSKICEKEAKESRYFIYEMSVSEENSEKSSIYFSHEKNLNCDLYDFWIEFYENEKQTTVVYTCFTDGYEDSKWIKVESGKHEDVRAKYFNEYLENYKNSIRKIHIHSVKEPLSNYSVKKLKHLEKLELFGVADNLDNMIESGFIDPEQLSRVKHLNIPRINLTFEQMMSLVNCTNIYVSSSEFNEETTKNYLKMLICGKAHEFLKSIKVHWKDGKVFDIHQVMNGLEVYDYKEVGEKKAFKFRVENKKKEVFRAYVSQIFEDSNHFDNTLAVFKPK